MFSKTFTIASRLNSFRFASVLLLGASFVLAPSPRAAACPFCSAVAQTLRQEMEAMDAVVIASALQSDSTRNTDSGEIRMKIEKVLKGEEYVKVGDEVIAVYFGDVTQGRRFLLSGVDPRDMQWSCLPLNERTEAYVGEIPRLAKLAESERLKFYMDYLQDEDSMLSRDAYDEFASASYAAVGELKDFMDHDQLLKWLDDSEMSADRKRLYFTMLGVCGSTEDLPLLEAMLRSTKKSSRSGLDALIACYLTLAGEEGLPIVNDLYLVNAKASYADTYAAIMAIRFHGTEGGVIARSALVESLQHILDREDLADLVIPDLARWQDWSQVEKMKNLFLEADEDNNWVRVPVVNYLRACPLPEAKLAIEELEKVDPKSVRRANTFFAVPKPAAEVKPTTSMTTPKVNFPGQEIESDVEMPSFGNARPGQLLASTAVGRSRLVAKTVEAGANPLRVLYVLTLALATLLVSLALVLTGGRMAPAEAKASLSQ